MVLAMLQLAVWASDAANCFCGPPAAHTLWRGRGERRSRQQLRRCACLQDKGEVMPTRCVTANPLHMPAEGLWCSTSFGLDQQPPPTKLMEDAAATELGALRIRSLLSRREAAAMVKLVDAMGFVQAEASAERRNGALSWALHDELCDALSARMAPHLPRSICSHRGDVSEEQRSSMLRVEGVRRALLGSSEPGGPPLVRRCDGAPEGTYRLAGINARCRVYRYKSDGCDSFAPHFDEVWPGSRLVIKGGETPQLEYDSWRYGETEAEAWHWGEGDRVSHFSLLVYLNDGFAGGETALLPPNAGEPVCVAPSAGDALCFGQSFGLGRQGIQTSEFALLHEGRPLLPGTAPMPAPAPDYGASLALYYQELVRAAGEEGLASEAVWESASSFKLRAPTAKYVLRSDILYWMPPPE